MQRLDRPGPPDGQNALICDWCGQVTPANYVHGHIQCTHCCRNIAPCCEGEICAPAAPGRRDGAGGA
jgi:hypothetical protein